jgi:sugar phosphate isomerase/epimerase
MLATPVDLQPLALSTMWMQHRYDCLADFAAAARALGFGGIEISHIVTPDMIAGADLGALHVRSVHYPAPTMASPFGLPAEGLLSSQDATQRTWAVAQGFASIDLAEKAGARAVCLHLGEVSMPRHLEWALCQRFLAGQTATQAYVAARREIELARAAASEPALTAARHSLAELSAYAASRGVRLGIESRVHYWQIPTYQELGVLLDESDPTVVGFWYDCGHVQVLHNLGFHDHQAWLRAYGERIVGLHLHDVIGLRDHLLPGQGELDFAWLLRDMPQEAVLTCELDWYFTRNEILEGAAYVAQLLAGL